MATPARRLAVERWKMKNREYYPAQKRYLAHRPEYLALRRQRYRVRQEKMKEYHSAKEKEHGDFTTNDPRTHRRGDRWQCGPTGAPSQRHGADPTTWAHKNSPSEGLW